MLADDPSVAQGDLEQLLATDQQYFADLLAAGAKADQELADLIAVAPPQDSEFISRGRGTATSQKHLKPAGSRGWR